LRVGNPVPGSGTHLSPAVDRLGGGDATRTVAGQRLPEISYLGINPLLLSFKPIDCGSDNFLCHHLSGHISFVGHSGVTLLPLLN
jgi:hypothetical protein